MNLFFYIYDIVTSFQIKTEVPNYAKACGDGAAEFGAWYKMTAAKKE